MPTSAQKLGDIVRTFRTEKGLTQAQLAEQIQPATNRSLVAHLEQGRRVPDPDILTRICSHLGIPRTYWEPFLSTDNRRVAEFEEILSELVGQPLSLDALD